MKKTILTISFALFTNLIFAQTNWQESSYYSNGLTTSLGKNYELSNLYLDSAIQINPNKYEYYEQKGLNYFRLNDYKNAIILLNKAIVLNPKCKYALLYRGYSKAKLEDHRGAINDFDKAINLLIQLKAKKGELAEALNNRAASKYAIGKYSETIVDCNLAISNDKDYSLAYYNKGLAYIELGQIDNGCIALSKAGELGFELAYDTIKENCQ